tara:strand:+ start:288 stop:503 length:216 start_codon:yes stop_codon:yes gene_type:complete
MNADILLENIENFQNEPVGDIVVKKSKLQGVTIDGSDVVDMVDEIPIFTLLASQAEDYKGNRRSRIKSQGV